MLCRGFDASGVEKALIFKQHSLKTMKKVTKYFSTISILSVAALALSSCASKPEAIRFCGTSDLPGVSQAGK